MWLCQQILLAIGRLNSLFRMDFSYVYIYSFVSRFSLEQLGVCKIVLTEALLKDKVTFIIILTL
jgi:hypothetical protein